MKQLVDQSLLKSLILDLAYLHANFFYGLLQFRQHGDAAAGPMIYTEDCVCLKQGKVSMDIQKLGIFVFSQSRRGLATSRQEIQSSNAMNVFPCISGETVEHFVQCEQRNIISFGNTHVPSASRSISSTSCKTLKVTSLN